MNSDDFKVFIEATSRYFETVSDRPATVFAPYLTSDITKHLNDYTGKISISGDYSGSVYVSAPRAMLSRVLLFLGILTDQELKIRDLIGEIGNTLAGNARRELGDRFLLSVPNVYDRSHQEPVKNIDDITVIPISWLSMKANVIVDVKRTA